MNPTSTPSLNGYFDSLADEIDSRAKALRPFWAMNAQQRLEKLGRGELNQDELYAWAARHPDEVPRINGEFAFIAASTPEACVPCPYCGDDEVQLVAGGKLRQHPDHRHRRTLTDASRPPAPRPACPASGLTRADALALNDQSVEMPQHALAA